MATPFADRSGRGLLAAVVAFTIASIALAVNASARPLDEVREHGTLRVNVYTDFKPFSWVEGDKVVGIDADIGRAIAKELGVKADIIARGAGEEVDDDIRSNIWQGPRTGGVKGDVLMHVPLDRELIARNNLAAISNGYYHEHVILALKSDVLGPDASLTVFEDGSKHKLACQFATSTHYFLAFARDGKIRNQVSPFVKFESAAENFLEGGSAGLMARRAQIEYTLRGHNLKLHYQTLEFPASLRSKWNVGTAVREDSRDLGHAIGRILRKLRSDGELQKIFANYGLTYHPPKRVEYEAIERPGYDPLPLHLRKKQK
ncbi:MAG: transporter substrate-binding domain-containing protein [Alphaproteobacteria bacterium]|nr:transporter substrate-binding domain-containing protein [Alphaproteobacteria bacterium]